MSYYKYAERDASAEVNWAQIGQNLTQTLQDEVKVREEKKAAIDAATREYDNTLNTAPQGEFQDGNKFTNDYVATQQKTRMMDDQLLKSGQMDLKTYTMRRQNGVDGTNQLFDLQKKFQSVYSERMEGILSGELTAQNSFELSQVQGFGDFSKSQALVNPVDGRVNIGITEMGSDGIKRVVPNSNIPVNVLMGKIQTPLAAFKANEATKALVDAQGDRVLSLFQAGSLAGAGSITELTGIDAISKFGKGAWTEAAAEMNNAISLSVKSMLANPRNLPSLLTGQVGGYSGESFTYDKDVAAKDKTKILLKASMDGSPGVMDENGPNYAAQKKQAEESLTVSIKSQMDAKVGKSAVSQAQLQERRPKTTEENSQKNMEMDAKNFAVNTSNFLYGTDAQKKEAITYFTGMGADIKVNPAGQPKGNYIMNVDGKYVPLETKGGDTTAGGRAAIGALLRATDQSFPQDLVFKNMKIGNRFNTSFSGTGRASERDVEGEYKAKIIDKVTPNLFKGQSVGKTVSTLKTLLKDVPGIRVVETNPNIPLNNTITISYLEGRTPKTIEVNSNENEEKATGHSSDLQKILSSIPNSSKLKSIGPEVVGGIKPKVKNAQGVGSKY